MARPGMTSPALTTGNRQALVRRPSPRLADGITTHIDRVPVDLDLARRQWDAYVATLAAAGWKTIEVDAADDCPDSVFVEDTVVMYGAVAVLAHPGADSRRGEVAGTEAALTRLGYRVARIEGPGTLDGGDVLKIGARVYVGRGGRTNGEGIRQLRGLLAPAGALVTAVPLTKVLHLKSAVTALPDGTVIGYSPVVDDVSFFPHYLGVPEEPGAHVVDLGEGRLLISAAAPATIARIGDLGYTPVPVEISEFEKLEGCVTCLSVRLRSAP